jgi:hypothetical protein
MKNICISLLFVLSVTSSRGAITVFNDASSSLLGFDSNGQNNNFEVPPYSSWTFEPANPPLNISLIQVEDDGATNYLETVTLNDGDALSVNDSGEVFQSSGIQQSRASLDSAYASYFMTGLESGSALAAILLGFIAVRRALSMGDNWND